MAYIRPWKYLYRPYQPQRATYKPPAQEKPVWDSTAIPTYAQPYMPQPPSPGWQENEQMRAAYNPPQRATYTPPGWQQNEQRRAAYNPPPQPPPLWQQNEQRRSPQQMGAAAPAGPLWQQNEQRRAAYNPPVVYNPPQRQTYPRNLQSFNPFWMGGENLLNQIGIGTGRWALDAARMLGGIPARFLAGAGAPLPPDLYNLPPNQIERLARRLQQGGEAARQAYQEWFPDWRSIGRRGGVYAPVPPRQPFKWNQPPIDPFDLVDRGYLVPWGFTHPQPLPQPGYGGYGGSGGYGYGGYPYYGGGGYSYTPAPERRPGMGHYGRVSSSPRVADWYGQMITWNI